jgi:hypothetical protein
MIFSHRLPAPFQLLGSALMKKLFVILLAVSVLGAFSVNAADAPKGKVVHVVAFKFKKAVTDAKQKEIADALVALKKSIPQIISIEHGPNVSKEGFEKGFQHAFIVTFANEKDRDTYLEHPKHKEFAKLLDGLLADKGVFVFDFVSKD